MLDSFKKYMNPVNIERLTTTDNGFGGVIETWTTLATINAYIRLLNGTERVVADKETIYSTHRMYCEITDITVADRINDNGNIYEVKLVDNKGEFMQVDLEYKGVLNV